MKGDKDRETSEDPDMAVGEPDTTSQAERQLNDTERRQVKRGTLTAGHCEPGGETSEGQQVKRGIRIAGHHHEAIRDT